MNPSLTPDVTANRPGDGRGNVIGALFATQAQAEKAIHDLKSASFSGSDIGLVLRDRDAQGGLLGEATADAGSGAGTGALGGGVLGGLAGLLVGVGALAIPGIGPVVAGGILASTLGVAAGTAAAGAGIGAAAGGLVGGLVGAGVPEVEAKRLHEGFQRGSVLLTVSPGVRAAEAERILRAAGGETGGTQSSDGGVGSSIGNAPDPATTGTIAPNVKTMPTENAVPETLIRQPQPPNEGSGRLLS